MKMVQSFAMAAFFPLALGCGLFEGSRETKNHSSVAAAGATGGLGGAGSGGAGATGSGGASAATGGSSACLAPAGPAMVDVPTPSGLRYCVDRTEVTQAQYQAFLAQVKEAAGSEHDDCKDNKTYQPVQHPSSMEGATCIAGESWTPGATPNRPVVCIDWCDAFAYCKWAGKRLCGKVGGGRGALTTSIDLQNPAFGADESQWYNACSQGGKSLYPYGSSYDPQACEGADVSQAGNGGWLAKKDVAARAGCRGTDEPFVSLNDMSGSVGEMTDECMWWQSSGGGSWDCAVRGGSMTSPLDELSCKFYGTSPIYVASSGTGFRCCKDLP
jgi:formylglycine-generating enzyme